MQVKVWNDNIYTFKQEWRENMIEIPAKSFVMMEEEDAYNFRGTYYPRKLDAGGTQVPQSYKMIRIEKGQNAPVMAVKTTIDCPACRQSFNSQMEYDKHAVNDHYAELDDREEAVAAIAKGKRGRPRKGTTE